MSDAAQEWQPFLAGFHRDRAGITERVLSDSVDRRGLTPYDWILQTLPASGLVVDLACGSAPLWSPALAGRYLGVDASLEELQIAASRGADALVHAKAADIPLSAGAAGVVVCSMALMVLPGLPGVLAEIRRVLAPDGMLVATVPTGRVSARDLPMVAGLVAALGRSPTYPNDGALRDAAGLFARSGLRLEGDVRRRFAFPLSNPEAADLMADSLYLPDLAEHRVRSLHRYLRGAVHLNAVMPVPIRRFVAHPATVGCVPQITDGPTQQP